MLVIICLTAVVLPIPVNTESERCSISDGGKNVNCKTQSLTQVPKFPVMDKIQKLILDNNKITRLPAGSFQSYDNLSYLKIDTNQITALQKGTFHGLFKLWYLSMKNNRLTALPGGIFDSLTALKQLHFPRNQITNLNLGIFDSLTKLQWLFINENKIVYLPVGIFDPLTELRQLSLEKNLLKSLPDGIFTSLTKLDFLWLLLNPLFSVPIELFTIVKPAKHLRLPFLCNCTENKDIILPLIQNVSFKTTIYNEKKVAVTSKWIHLTNTCNSSCLDFQECTSKETCTAEETTIYKSTESVSTEQTPMETTGTTHYWPTRTESHQSKSGITHYRSARTESTRSTAGILVYTSTRTESIPTTSIDAEGITYTAVAAIIGAVASAVILYHASKFKMPPNLVKSQKVAQAAVEDAVEDMLKTDFGKQENGPECTNVPPMSHQDMIRHL